MQRELGVRVADGDLEVLPVPDWLKVCIGDPDCDRVWDALGVWEAVAVADDVLERDRVIEAVCVGVSRNTRRSTLLNASLMMYPPDPKIEIVGLFKRARRA